jgi:guanylate kinase
VKKEKAETQPASCLLLVLSAPTGGGKTTIARRLVEGDPSLRFSVSHTTRKPRPGERDGVDYHFVSEADFAVMAERGEFLEWARVHGSGYGTHRSECERASKQGETLVLDVDVQGGLQVKMAATGAILVFILPPSFEVLLERLGKRRAEPGFDLARRLVSALKELESASVYDYTIVNEDLGVAVDQVRRILDAASLRSPGGLERVSRLSHDITRWLRSHDVHRP